MAKVYQHPDGHAIAFDGSALHFGDEDAGTYGRVPIGPAGLVELGKTLQALGRAELAQAKKADRERSKGIA